MVSAINADGEENLIFIQVTAIVSDCHEWTSVLDVAFSYFVGTFSGGGVYVTRSALIRSVGPLRSIK